MIKKDHLPAYYFADHYRHEIIRLSELHGQYFDEFTRDFDCLIDIGNKLLIEEKATGYNFITSPDVMDLASQRPTIFYSHAVITPKHIGLLIEILMKNANLNPSDLKIGLRASRFIHGDWKLPQDKRLFDIIHKQDGSALIIDQSVESVLNIFPRSMRQAQDVLRQLNLHVFANKPNALEDSWIVPDIRLTENLLPFVPQEEFRLVKANIFSHNQAQIVVLRKKTLIPHANLHAPTGINTALVGFIISEKVGE